MTPTLTNRIARIASPNVVELDLKRRAKVFGRLNVAPSFDLVAQIKRTEANGDVRAEFARRAASERK